ncbi:hypothetical protein GcM3_218046, partial [Golovinomyces cichoracearum]
TQWLSQNQYSNTISVREYRNLRGWRNYTRNVIQEYRAHMGWDRINESNEVIESNTKWTIEEVYAWTDAEDAKAEEVFD